MLSYPQVQHTWLEAGLRIQAPEIGGFDIGILREGGEWVVYFGESGFHERFGQAEEAVELVAFGLSDDCRLREVHLPLFHRSRVERWDGQGWSLAFEFGRPAGFLPLRRVEHVYRNRLLRSGTEGA